MGDCSPSRSNSTRITHDSDHGCNAHREDVIIDAEDDLDALREQEEHLVPLLLREPRERVLGHERGITISEWNSSKKQ